MSETVSIAETAPYCFLFNGSIFFFAMVLLCCGGHSSERGRNRASLPLSGSLGSAGRLSLHRRCNFYRPEAAHLTVQSAQSHKECHSASIANRLIHRSC